MIKHFTFTYPYLLILHIFFIFTSFSHIHAKNFLDQKKLLNPEVKINIDTKTLNSLSPMEQQAIYVFNARHALEENQYKKANEWADKIDKNGFFGSAQQHIKFKVKLKTCESIVKSPSFSSKKFKAFQKCHNASLQRLKSIHTAFVTAHIKTEIKSSLKRFMFHNFIAYIIEKDNFSSKHIPIHHSLSLTTEQKNIISAVVDVIPNTKHKKRIKDLMQSFEQRSEKKSNPSTQSWNQKDASQSFYDQISRNGKKDVINAYLKLIHEFPNSLGAQSAYSKILAECRKNPKAVFLNIYYYKEHSLPFDLLYDMAHILWNQKLNSFAQMSFQKSIEYNPFHEKANKAQFYTARIYEDQLKWDQAKKSYMNFSATYPGSALYNRVIFKLGLISYILNQEDKSRRYLNTFYDLAESNNEKGQALFWQIRLAQKFGKTESVSALKSQLQNVAPLSFYAAKENLWPELIKRSTSRPTADKNSTIYNAYLLTLAGFKKQALDELKQINLNYSHNEFSNYLDLWHANHDHTTPVILSYRAIHSERNRKKIDIDLIENVFPKEYVKEIRTATENSNLSSNLILAIIKQESAFNPKAKSPAGAYGLMQLMPNTAKSLFKAKKNQTSFNEEVLYEPITNISLGQTYLQKLKGKYNNNLVYVASNYNAGANPLKTWDQRWKKLDEDIFIEMIPYKETRNYVKLVLRNFYFYQFLNNKNIDK